MRRLVVALVVAACGAVQGTELSRAPTNVCSEHPCEDYAPGKTTKSTCSIGRCEISGRPDFPFTIVITPPSNSGYAPGYTFAQPSTELFEPKTSHTGCPRVTCLELPTLYEAVGSFRVAGDASKLLGYPLAEQLSVPVNARYIPRQTNDALARDLGLPLQDFIAASRNTTKPSVAYDFPITTGLFRRLTYPQPPYDAYLPPTIDEIEVPVPTEETTTLSVDEKLVSQRKPTDPAGTQQLDDPSGDSRTAHVSRDDGLDGFRIWIADTKTGDRVSVVKTLMGTADTVRLSTAGQSAGNSTALRDGLDVVVAPPTGWIAVPQLVSGLIGGSGLAGVVYPSLPQPASVNGVIATRTEQGLAGIAGQVTFVSTSIVVSGGTVENSLLRYRTTVLTDDKGRFATVVPQGTYNVVIEPAEGTSFGKILKILQVTRSIAPTLEPQKRSTVVGHVVLSDHRPLASATILALPSHSQSDPLVVPRAGRAVTDDTGAFSLALDQGRYDVTIVPEAGTGFPRVVTIRGVGAELEDLGSIVVPAPMKVQFTVRAPARAGGAPIPGAIVRFFAPPADGSASVEVGNTMTDATGRCEILLAQEPR